ncbi:dynein regulatory complex subunit 7 isoform X1 [Poecile atricapillus]|uniref:dynein regulatory complex subunit 7 isoform X1 n=1 Tax=Poecile atricapillus TaxID=48891 RepID=UPI00273858C5|nr:dynein regulatory complex subunit 7 isoform X1 [Poecile atricapillus]XP_058701592.1 dynein regulatory complex subunit 7 isoform X1 [Poecile atricapillus]
MEALEETEEVEKTPEDEISSNISDFLDDLETDAAEKKASVSDDEPDFDWSSIDTSLLPSSYKTNSQQEKELLQLADHFFQQYAHLCPDRKPLFIYPVNECGVQKFVSTTVRPTLLPFPDMYYWSGCASFVCDYLIMEPLKCPLTPPSSLYSPTTILKYQRGNCFDFTVLLCSLLIGAGYDAYCVHGYATLEMCSLDQTQELCPLLRKPPEVPEEEDPNKYRIKYPLEPQSKFLLQQQAKKEEETESAEKEESEEEVLMEVGKPKRDPLHGLRVHAWVLVLSGKRKVPETFFINPFTGNHHSTMDECFLGIESIWNHRNYWVNMQDCRKGCKDLSFDLSDSFCWEIMLSESNEPSQLPTESPKEDTDDMQEKGEIDMSFEMPLSWVAQIRVSCTEYENPFSQGKKVILYDKAKLEKWAAYANRDGLVERLTVYADSDRTEELEVKEWFKHREDLLYMREVNKQTQLITDHFSPGHPLLLKAHSYTSLEPETGHTVEFYHMARVDGLCKRFENATEMTEYFVGREDFLHMRHIEFGERDKKTEKAGIAADANPRPIVQIKEYFHRNPEKPADEDIEERIFMVIDDIIQLTYHLELHDTIASKVVFCRVIGREKREDEIFLSRENTVKYQPWSSEKHKNMLHLYNLLWELRAEQKELKQQVRDSEAEMLNILMVREGEEASIKLTVPMFNIAKRGQRCEAMVLEEEQKSSHSSLENKSQRIGREDESLAHHTATNSTL